MLILLLIVIIIAAYGALKPLPEGVSIEGEVHKSAYVAFLYDLTYEKDGEIIREQTIFNEVFDIISGAEKFIIIDMFLFNDEYNRIYEYPELSAELTDALISKKNKQPEIKITFITDEINTFYGSYKCKYLEKLKDNNINVIITDMTKFRDSNPAYSGVWRTFFQWFGTSGKGWLPNVFSPDAPKVTFRSYLKLINFKANHRKVIVTEKKGLLTSANPHDASAYHSNIAFVIEGDVINDIITSEKAIANLSGGNILGSCIPERKLPGNIEVSLLTEGKIKKHFLEAIKETKQGDTIQIGMFYLSERELMKELLKASKRGVNVLMILDPSKDAFGRGKSGIPNRPVAAELFKKSKGAINIRWYSTHGEQFHTKMAMVKYQDSSVIFGGSANITRRNIGDYNIESDLKISASNDSDIVTAVSRYFDRIWNNSGGNYTVDFNSYYEKSLIKKIVYRFQEWIGMASY